MSLNDAACKERAVAGAACGSYERWHSIVLLALTLLAFAIVRGGHLLGLAGRPAAAPAGG